MSSIRKITQVTDNRFLNMFDLDVIHRSGKPGLYHIASRARSIEELKLSTRINKADGVIIYALYGEKRDREENVSLMCAYMMMHFLHADPENPFSFLEVKI